MSAGLIEATWAALSVGRNIALVNVEKIITALGIQPSEFFKALDKPVEGIDKA